MPSSGAGEVRLRAAALGRRFHSKASAVPVFSRWRWSGRLYCSRSKRSEDLSFLDGLEGVVPWHVQVRVWYQSFVHPGGAGAPILSPAGAVDSVAGPGVRFEVHGLDPPGPFVSPADRVSAAPRRSSGTFLGRREGGLRRFRDRPFPGALEIRGSLDIPVIGRGEPACRPSPWDIEWAWSRRSHFQPGMIARCACTVPSASSGRRPPDEPSAFMKAFHRGGHLRHGCAQFVAQVKPLIEKGAEVIILPAACPCCCSLARARSSSMASGPEWTSWPRPPRWLGARRLTNVVVSRRRACA